ncbi:MULTISPECIES: response regulator transcription factor FruA [Stigmatella]|nr:MULTISPECIES: response regulator transcription factor [Stigmatella]
MAQNQLSVRISVLEGPWSAWQGLADGLRSEGLNVMSVTRDVRTLLDSLGTDPPQVTILDVEPDHEATVGCSVTEGLNLLREARKRRLEVRMLMLSAVSAPDIISQCFDEGASGYLFRAGLGVGAVATAIHGLIRGERLFPVQLLRNDFEHPPAATQPASVLNALTQREREVLGYVAGGADNLKIAAHLQIAERTVKSHVTQLYRKLGAENRTQLALRACHLGVRPPPDL